MSEVVRNLDQDETSMPPRRQVSIDFSQVDFSDTEVRRRLGRVYALLYQYRRVNSISEQKEGETYAK